MTQVTTSDILVVGAGPVGASLALGLAQAGASVRVLDGGDDDLRAARANFGLVWVQGKGIDMPAYAQWTRRSADLWGDFAGELGERTGVTLNHRQKGGLSFCIGPDAFDVRCAMINRLHNQREEWSPQVEMVERTVLEAMLPHVRLGAEVTGASFCPQDGECDPLALLRALLMQVKALGVNVHHGVKAETVAPVTGGFRVTTTNGVFEAARLVLAAGHGSADLARQVGLDAPIRPQRGQILVTERLQHFLPYAGDTIRQTSDGTVMVGATHEDVGFDLATTPQAGAELSRHAIAVFPDLAGANLVRTWSGLRILTPDGCPLYAQSKAHPGAYLVTCHSGITLAAVHARVLAPALLESTLGAALTSFGPERFKHVGQAAHV